MRIQKALLTALLAIASIPELQSQTISGPILGFVADQSGEAVSPVLGVPGASMLGEPVSLSAAYEALAVSPRQDYAVGLQRQEGSGHAVVVDLTRPGFPVLDVPGSDSLAESIIAISPTGTSAAIYDRGARRVLIVDGLPRTARVQTQIDASGVPGEVTALAVSDDGLVALLKSGDSMWAVNTTNLLLQVPVTSPRVAAFVPNHRDAIVLDNATRSALLLRDIGQTNDLTVLSFADDAATFVAASASEDGRTAFLAADSGDIQIVEVTTGYVSEVSCGCSPTVVAAMKGTSVFRLTESASEPMAMLDASTSSPRIVLILPRVSE